MKHFKNHYPVLLLTALLFTSCHVHKKLPSSTTHPPTSGEPATSSVASLQAKYSALLNVSKNDIQTIPLYALIDEWYGTAYKYGGCNKSGIDCSNFAAIIYQEIYKKTIKGSSASIYNQCIPVNKSELKEGDLLFFKINKQTISHIGVYLQNNKFVHATTQKGVMINDLNEPYYLNYFYKAGRVK